jgi:CRP/FNR family transcriptional regulator
MSNETWSCIPVQATFRLGAEMRSADDVLPESNFADFRSKWNDASAARRTGNFFSRLSPDAISQFESLAAPYRCKTSKVLISEGESPGAVLILLEGNVKVTMNSIDGHRLILGIAGMGEILGLAAAVSGHPYEITAEAQFPCKLASIPRRTFLDFLDRYPVAAHNVGLQLSQDYIRACEQLRFIGIKMNSGTRLARLLLKWCADGGQTDCGTRITCSLTHEEIGECIGVARETVSRTLSDFKHRKLVVKRGSTLVIGSVRALEIYADRNGD